jgi:hypothetical protein
MKLPVTVQKTVDATAPVENNHHTPAIVGPQLEDPPRATIARAALAVAVAELVMATAVAEAAVARAHHMVLGEEVVVAEIAETETT